jgi:hypothetical protein
MRAACGSTVRLCCVCADVGVCVSGSMMSNMCPSKASISLSASTSVMLPVLALLVSVFSSREYRPEGWWSALIHAAWKSVCRHVGVCVFRCDCAVASRRFANALTCSTLCGCPLLALLKAPIICVHRVDTMCACLLLVCVCCPAVCVWPLLLVSVCVPALALSASVSNSFACDVKKVSAFSLSL